MLVTLSPAKLQNFDPVETSFATLPRFASEADYLIDYLKDYEASDLGRLLAINPKQAMEVYQWTQAFDHARTPQKQAAFAYNGMVFLGLNIQSLSAEDLAYTQDHLMLFSALYGVLRPLDLIKPYRLDLTTKLSTEKAEDLYGFWRKLMNQVFVQQLHETGGVWVNLTSNEYSKIIDRKAFPKGTQTVTINFKEQMPSGLQKQIVVYTKKARGLMARFIMQHRIEKLSDLKAFDIEGYSFSPSLSHDDEWTFTR